MGGSGQNSICGVVNHTMRLLGRQGVLDATAVEPSQAGQAASDLVPLQDLMKNTAFKAGQRYTDYQKGDKVSDIGLAGLIAGEDDSAVAEKDDAATSGKSAGIWGWYVLAGVVAGGGVLLFLGVVQQRRKPRRDQSASPVDNGTSNEMKHEPAHEPAAVAFTVPAVVADQVLESDEVKPVEVKPIGERPQVAIATNGSSKHRPSRRRRKIFDYHRFYVDTVMKLSSSGYTAEVPAAGEHANGHSNGHANGHSNGNGHTNGHSNGAQPKDSHHRMRS